MIADSEIDPKNIACIGISSQRASFITWNLKTGKHYHRWECHKKRDNGRLDENISVWIKFYDYDCCFRFIIWKDQRAANLVEEWNRSIMIRSLRMGAGILYTLTRKKRFLAGSVLKFMNMQVEIFHSQFSVYYLVHVRLSYFRLLLLT